MAEMADETTTPAVPGPPHLRMPRAGLPVPHRNVKRCLGLGSFRFCSGSELVLPRCQEAMEAETVLLCRPGMPSALDKRWFL